MEKEIPVISMSQFRRIKAQGGNPVLVRRCNNCGYPMEKLRGVTNKMKPRIRWICLNCGTEHEIKETKK